MIFVIIVRGVFLVHFLVVAIRSGYNFFVAPPLAAAVGAIYMT